MCHTACVCVTIWMCLHLLACIPRGETEHAPVDSALRLVSISASLTVHKGLYQQELSEAAVALPHTAQCLAWPGNRRCPSVSLCVCLRVTNKISSLKNPVHSSWCPCVTCILKKCEDRERDRLRERLPCHPSCCPVTGDMNNWMGELVVGREHLPQRAFQGEHTLPCWVWMSKQLVLSARERQIH